ncbi:hypothetical protein IL992_15400 [Microbispora sp. NEAU-D428]|uniref:hypothetical protein n=1 Tax=Microbispora sitophila TaxID=2771537 RepID=UPI0018670059|nr:hypothetical protein [Microbispora sitophila]MBE3010570.1 hypothetical protein [Microbispora sitophila]
MADEITAGRNAARALAARTPGWMVWYGERTGSFWAVPRAGTAIVPRILEAPTADDLENEIRQAEGRPAREQAQEKPQPGQPDRAQQPSTEIPRHRHPAPEAEAPRIPVRH